MVVVGVRWGDGDSVVLVMTVCGDVSGGCGGGDGSVLIDGMWGYCRM